MKTTLTFLATVALFSLAHAAGSGDALSVLNSFVATFAKDNPAWKADIVVTNDPSHVPAGRQLGYSSMVGYYTFVPKTWESLTEEERKEVYNDARLKPFIVSLRNTQNYPALTETDTPKPVHPVYPVEGSSYPTQRKGVYYTTDDLSPEQGLTQPVHVQGTPRYEGARLKIAPEEMVVDRPMKVYIYNN